MQRQLRFALAIELPHARYGVGHILDGALHGLQIFARARAEIRLVFQQRFGVERDGRNGVVDVVCDAAGHLAERAQAFLLHDGLLRLAQIVVGLLQGRVELRLMRGQRDVLAQLPQKFAFAAAESCPRCVPGGDQNAEDLALHQQRRGHQRAQSAARQPLGERENPTWLISGS